MMQGRGPDRPGKFQTTRNQEERNDGEATSFPPSKYLAQLDRRQFDIGNIADSNSVADNR